LPGRGPNPFALVAVLVQGRPALGRNSMEGQPRYGEYTRGGKNRSNFRGKVVVQVGLRVGAVEREILRPSEERLRSG